MFREGSATYRVDPGPRLGTLLFLGGNDCIEFLGVLLLFRIYARTGASQASSPTTWRLGNAQVHTSVGASFAKIDTQTPAISESYRWWVHEPHIHHNIIPHSRCQPIPSCHGSLMHRIATLRGSVYRPAQNSPPGQNNVDRSWLVYLP